MQITILGTGSPEGHPIVLHSNEFVKNGESKLRPGLLVKDTDTVIFDTNPDIRQQLLHEKITNITALFITHQHFDHLWGIADLAQLLWLGDVSFTTYVNLDTLQYIQTYLPWVKLPLQVFNYDEEYKFNHFTVIPRQAKHSKKFETAVFEIVKNDKVVLYAPDFKGFETYKNTRPYEVAVIDGSYYFGKYIEDEDHLGGEELHDLIMDMNAKENYLIGVSPFWYKKSIDDLTESLEPHIKIPADYTKIKV